MNPSASSTITGSWSGQGESKTTVPFPNSETSPFFVFSLEGAQSAEWPLPGTIRVAVFGAPGIAGVEVRAEKSLVLIDPLAGTIMRRDPVPQDFPRVQFGDGGRIYCLGDGRRRRPHRQYLYCACAVSTRYGQEFLLLDRSGNGEPFDVARDAPVLAATDSFLSRVIFHAFDETDIGANVSSVGVWDLRRGVELLRLKGQKQRQRVIGFKNGIGFPYWDRAARLALAPQGDRLAIAADDVLSLYEIPTE